MTKKVIDIDEIPNEIHDNALDLIGNEFKFDHAKGVAEWLKNSVDAYRRNDIKQEDQFVVFRFTDQGVQHPVVECIDFMGMTDLDIEKALKIWFDPNAAKRGKGVKVYGGHGNGGKFYMRQMFRESRFITYKNGLLNIFGFSVNKKYGYAKGFNNKKIKPAEALEFAEISKIQIPTRLKDRILSGETGFTIVQGIGPEGIRGKFRISKEIDRFKNHPQSRRILEHSNVSVIYNGSSLYGLLKPDTLEPMEKFENPKVIIIPDVIEYKTGHYQTKIKFSSEKYPAGKLILKTSSEALSRGSKLEEMNRIDILGEIGVIGSYKMTELGVTGWPYAAFIYGEFCPAREGEASILEDLTNDCVSNDRSRLVENDTTKALLEWIVSEIDSLAKDIGAVEREKQKISQKEITSKFNDVLNEWKNKHMHKIISDIFGGTNISGIGGDQPGTKSGEYVSVPPNGFDFKYPQAEIELNVSSRLTLKVCVPQILPIGSKVFFTSNSEDVIIEDKELGIKSDFIKTSLDGQEVAFLNISVIGKKIGSEASIKATAGRNNALMKVIVVSQKDEKNSGKTFPQVLLSSHHHPIQYHFLFQGYLLK